VGAGDRGTRTIVVVVEATGGAAEVVVDPWVDPPAGAAVVVVAAGATGTVVDGLPGLPGLIETWPRERRAGAPAPIGAARAVLPCPMTKNHEIATPLKRSRRDLGVIAARRTRGHLC
jgi:hypothetical protein